MSDLLAIIGKSTTSTSDVSLRPDRRRVLVVPGKRICVDTGKFEYTIPFVTIEHGKTELQYTPLATQCRVMGEFLFVHRDLYSPERRVPSECAVVEYHPDFGIEGIGSILGPIYLDTLAQNELRIGDQLENMVHQKRADFDELDITFYLRIYCFSPREQLGGSLKVRETFGEMALEVGKYFVDVAAETYRGNTQ